MRILFVKERFAWPRSSGHDVHCFELMRALSQRGHQIFVASLAEPPDAALAGCACTGRFLLDEDPDLSTPVAFTKSQEKFRAYWGVRLGSIRTVGSLVERHGIEAVVVVGLNVLPYLGAVKNAIRIWYAGDEWVWHHLSQFRLWQRSTWSHLRQALVKGYYERSFTSLVDRVWMVSQADAHAWRRVTGHDQVDVVPNGVDQDYYAPIESTSVPYSCIFWGRLDFGPNLQALQWFCQRIWPRILRRQPQARFDILGFQATAAVHHLVARTPGTSLAVDKLDIRADIARAQVVVLPFVSGGGIKNKLLEAAALAKAIVCSPRVLSGLEPGNAIVVARSSQDWLQALNSLWNNEQTRRDYGQAARAWVTAKQTWAMAAEKALAGLAQPCHASCLS